MNRLHVFWVTPGGAVRDTGEVYDADQIGCETSRRRSLCLSEDDAIVATDDIVDEDDEQDAIDVAWGESARWEPAREYNHSHSGYDSRFHGIK